MPHFQIHYHLGEAAAEILPQAMQIAFDLGASSHLMQAEDIKIRCIENSHILFGDGRTSFLHIEIAMLAGRSDAAKLSLATALVTALRQACPAIAAISVDCRDMNPACYKKSLA